MMATDTYTNPPTTRDCPPGFCNSYCRQWCFIFPPPPPFDTIDGSSSSSLSPLVIAIIGILASAFLLIGYYAVVSKYCNNRRHSPCGEGPVSDDVGQTRQDAWQVTLSEGLDESVIKSIAVCKYKKGDGFVEGTDCSVCLAEFRDDEQVRLLPRCGHAFHIHCIDTWLKSHSNCPLCRANIPPVEMQVAMMPSQEAEDGGEVETRRSVEEVCVEGESSGRGVEVNHSKWSRSRALECVVSGVQMKRSTKQGRGNNDSSILPV